MDKTYNTRPTCADCGIMLDRDSPCKRCKVCTKSFNWFCVFCAVAGFGIGIVVKFFM